MAQQWQQRPRNPTPTMTTIQNQLTTEQTELARLSAETSAFEQSIRTKKTQVDAAAVNAIRDNQPIKDFEQQIADAQADKATKNAVNDAAAITALDQQIAAWRQQLRQYKQQNEARMEAEHRAAGRLEEEIQELQQKIQANKAKEAPLKTSISGLENKLAGELEKRFLEDKKTRKRMEKLFEADHNVGVEEKKKLIAVGVAVLFVGAAIATGGIAAAVGVVCALAALIYAHFTRKSQNKAEKRLEKLQDLDDQQTMNPAVV